MFHRCLTGYGQDNADYERGWFAGVHRGVLYFAISTSGTQRLNGQYGLGCPYPREKWVRLKMVYNGSTIQIFVDGIKCHERVQTGRILYPAQDSWFAIGAFVDENENKPLACSIMSISLSGSNAVNPDVIPTGLIYKTQPEWQQLGSCTSLQSTCTRISQVTG